MRRRFTSTTITSRKNALPQNIQEAVSTHYIPVTEKFVERHVGSSPSEVDQMLKALDPPVSDIDEFIKQSLPPNIRAKSELRFQLPPDDIVRDGDKAHWGMSEDAATMVLQKAAGRNKLSTPLIGCGYYGTIVPPVIQRNVLENPAWYTSYTPYQAEISQGRLESLVNFQTAVTDLTGMNIANASLLDEATAAAEAMTMSMNILPLARQKNKDKAFVVSDKCHPQTIAVLESRANGFGINILVGDILADDCKLVKDQGEKLIGVLAQYPDTYGGVYDFKPLADTIHQAKATFAVATDLLALTHLKPPGEFGADIAFGSAQRFGVPMGYGGPHAAFFACSEQHKRKIPGRLVGVSKDRLGNPAMRLALQTREQHIRREKATSNVCTAQALLANMAAMYAVYHGPKGLEAIANKVWTMANLAQRLLSENGYKVVTDGLGADGAVLFDTLVVEADEDKIKKVLKEAARELVAFRPLSSTRIGMSFGEDIHWSLFKNKIMNVLGVPRDVVEEAIKGSVPPQYINTIPEQLRRTSQYLTHPVFNTHHTETELLRYIHHLGSKDLSLVHSMIPLGSCTMKLNATTEMLPITLEKWAFLHPFAPPSHTEGYKKLTDSLSRLLVQITGMDDISLQPNSGAQGEFAGLRAIKKYQESRADGNLDLKDLEEKCKKHADSLAAIMVTYPSTFGVFEPEIKRVCELVHEHGGQVYMDGANMNAQIGLCSPGEIGADVCHLNLHKTFCIPHGGGGPGVGPIAVKQHLAKHLPGHPFMDPHASAENSDRSSTAISPVSAAPFGSALILPISWLYIVMMGSAGLTYQTKIALLNANYIMSRLRPHYPIVYTNENSRCAHEFILDARQMKETCGIEVVDIAKRLQDYGFHSPTMSWPIANTLMIEPTESESKEELDRFCDAFIAIRKEIKDIEDGKVPKENNLLKNAPHTQEDLLRADWDRPYTREQAAYPMPYLRKKKFWPSVARIDDAYGDTNLFCSCTPVEGFEQEQFTGHQAPMPT
ncbi:glycine decarboxylase subunit P [Exophiala xenobiotica]|uniref:glycine dehydrogenase (aminomethyl-transferring) n=1 Tax=Lithohypha guttulata TaxID=1690604 RepID=A0ABR0KQL0_9EURO|nr:glycine decarboxylase subunit P [Lithohypha guttulata]KAK5330479.1 glycine decarboxylase subunit P [Exophiala xenobiotica]